MDTVETIIELGFSRQHSFDQMQRKTSKLENAPRSIVLRIHPGKSKVMKVKTDSTATITIERKSLEEVDTFTNLGSRVGTQIGTEEDIKSRIDKAKGAFVVLNKNLEGEDHLTKHKAQNFQF